MSKTTQQITDRKNYVVELVRSTNAAGIDFYAYVLIRKDTQEHFRQLLLSKSVDLKQHGVILASGPGKDPEPDLHARIVQEYDFSA